MQLLILFILIITIIISIKEEEKDKCNQMIEEYRQYKLESSRKSRKCNREILNKVGEKSFIQYFGKEQYDKVKAGTDIGIVKMLPEYRRGD